MNVEETRLLRTTLPYILLSIISAIFMILTPFFTGSAIAATYHTSPGLSNPSIIPRNGIFELTLAEQIDYGTQNNFFVVTVSVTFTSPSNVQTTVGGFYYETLDSGTSLWKARFSPSEIGTYSYSYTLTHIRGIQSTGSGSFQVVSSDNPGFIRQNPSNPFRWEFPNGEPFYPIGFNGGGGLNDVTNTDGGDRFGAFVGGRVINNDEHFSMFSNAGFNMIRFSQDNGAIPRLATDAAGGEGYDVYDETAAFYHDWFMQKLRSHNFRIFYGLFGFEDHMENPPSPERLAFARYAVDRWAAYVDVWEIFNEETAPDDQWLVTIANEIKARDPYKHPITTSWHQAAGRVPEIEITTPHRYLHEDELTSDQVAAGWANFKSWGKPIILGEQGNSDMNWLPDSALRMRIRGWTAFFKEVSVIFWQTSWATNGMGQGVPGSGARNIYLGYEERQYNHIMMWFVDQVLKSDSVESPVTVSNRNLMRAYGLSSSDGFAAYIHHYADHTNTLSGQTITFGAAQAGEGYWIDPTTGQLLGTVDVSARSNTLTIPDFVVDIALFSTAFLGDTKPIAQVVIDNPQADGDLDDDGAIDYGPFIMPFGMPPLTLNFDASNSYDLDGGEVSFSWDYGDGSAIESEASVSHTYTDGDYLTTLTVTDDEGNAAQHGFIVRATADPNPNRNDPPVFQLATHSITVREGEPVIVSVSASDSELEAGQYVNSNDDFTYSASNLPPGAVFGTWGVNWIKQLFWLPDFDQAGSYQVQFSVQDAQGVSATPQTLTIDVLDVPGNAITVDPSITYQTITGWEATAWVAEPSDPAFPNYKDTLLDQLVNDIGINRVRLGIRSGVENGNDNWAAYQAGDIDYQTWRSRRYATVNDNSDPCEINWAGFHFSEMDYTVENVVLPIMQLVEARGERLFVNVNYVAFTGQITGGGTYIHDDPVEYAEFVLATYQHLQNKYGWVPDAWEVLLEPDNVAQWNGTLLGQAIVAAAGRLKASGFTPSFIAPSNTNMANAISYFDQMVQVPGAVQYLREFSYHRYGGVSDTNLQGIASRAVQHNISTSMLEWWFDNATYHILHKDLTMGRNSAWQQETIRGFFDIDDSNPNNPIVSVKDVTKFNRQYYEFVRPGAVRIEAASQEEHLDPLAFINDDGRYVVVVKCGAGADFSIGGLAAGTYGVKYTTAGAYDVDLPDRTIAFGQPVTAGIPDAGVLTVYAKPMPLDDEPPSAPTDLTAKTVLPTQVVLTWSPSADDTGVAGYKVYRDEVRVGFAPGTSYDDAQVKPGVAYAYVVSAYDAAGNESPPSQPLFVTMPVSSQAGDLIGYWTFDEGQGNVAMDSSGHGHNGTIMGATWTVGIAQAALHFGGFGDYVEIVTDADVDNLEAVTMAAWIYPARDAHWHVLDKGDGDKRLYAEGLNRTLDARIRYTGAHAFSRSVNTTVVLNAWQHVALVWSRATDTTRIYRNGSEVTYQIHDVGTGVPLDDTTSPWTIGARGALGEGTFFDGSIDEVRLYRRALSAQEIRDIYLIYTPAPPRR